MLIEIGASTPFLRQENPSEEGNLSPTIIRFIVGEKKNQNTKKGIP